MISVATWNVNSINVRLPLLLKWLEKYKPDVVLLQELKCIDEKFPKQEIEDLGYNLAIHGQKTYNGVAILSLLPIDEVIVELESNPLPGEARYIEAVLSIKNSVIRVASVYVPNGQEIGCDKYHSKLQFFDAVFQRLEQLLSYDEICVVGGDFNVAYQDIDVFDSSGLEQNILFDLATKGKMRSLLNLGYIDAFRTLYPGQKQFSWWDYRAGAWQKNQGVRIDYLLLSPEAADCLKEVRIEQEMRGVDNPSDHVPVMTHLNLS